LFISFPFSESIIKTRPGGRLTREELFTADPREPPEVVNLDRVPGTTGFRRVN
jgi:hypothetical protein